MEAVVRLLKSINDIVKADDEELKEELADFDERDYLVKRINKYEKDLYKELKKQRDYFLDGIESYVAKDLLSSVTLSAFLNYALQDLFAADEFAIAVGAVSAEFLGDTIQTVTKKLMETLDKDVAFATLSGRTVAWIEDWSEELGQIMQLNSHTAVEAILVKTLNEGKGIPDAVKALKGLPEFDRNRARATAITEVLAANSASQLEAYTQSPAVTQKRWRHSGAKKNKPRRAHQALDGTTINVDEMFDVNGHDAQYPRDSALPAGERVYCHCVLQPVTDPAILGLSPADKEAIRQRTMEEFDYDKYKTPKD